MKISYQGNFFFVFQPIWMKFGGWVDLRGTHLLTELRPPASISRPEVGVSKSGKAVPFPL